MFARLVALLCLMNVSSQALELVVYLRTDGKQASGPLEAMKHELTPLMHQAGYRIEWRDALMSDPIAADGTLIVVDLHGACGIPAGSYAAESAPEDLNRLAATAVSDGRVLPFASVNCANLNRTLGAALASEAGARRDFLYGRALARVLAHEFYHIIVGTREHTSEGLSRPSFTRADLLGEGGTDDRFVSSVGR